MNTQHLDLATFAGGCFWCTEAIMQQVNGVTNVVSGYANGHSETPDYQSVCTGKTGHAEVVQVTFDPDVVTYGDLVSIFMTSHDPTLLNRQGADLGTQYRSGIYYHDEYQRQTAEAVVKALEGAFPGPIVTEIVPLRSFHSAEDRHQDYYNQHQNAGYCRVVIAPKLSKLRAQHAPMLKPAS